MFCRSFKEVGWYGVGLFLGFLFASFFCCFHITMDDLVMFLYYSSRVGF